MRGAPVGDRLLVYLNRYDDETVSNGFGADVQLHDSSGHDDLRSARSPASPGGSDRAG